MAKPHLLMAAPDGQIFEHPSLELALDTGLDVVRPGKKDLIPIREGWDIMALPDTLPIGFDSSTGQYVTVESYTLEGSTFTPRAVAVHPPPGYVRTHHPAAQYLDLTHPDVKLKEAGAGALPVFGQNQAAKAKAEDAGVCGATGGDDAARPGLPLWAYTAVGYDDRRGFVAALMPADETSRWDPSLFYKPELQSQVDARLAEDPDNPVLAQIASCATAYKCCCAENVFYGRWEGALPIAPACTAACLGCLSKDAAFEAPTPQKRLKFAPTPDEIARVAATHLENAAEPMISYGQGCEGEPTMNGPVFVESVRLTRERTKRGILNVNTNGSRPETIAKAADVGLNALRISINTFDPKVYTDYYRPADYSFETVMESLQVGKEKGLFVSINFLIWPGWTDRVAELERVSELVTDGLISMIQLRNLCVDPGHFRSVLPPREERGLLLGMRPWIEELHKRHPALRFGTFNPRLAADWYKKVPSLVAATA